MRVMTKKGLLPVLAFLLFAPNIRGQSNSPAKALSDSIRRVVFDGEAFLGEGQAMPRWSNGYLVARRVETFLAGVPNVRVYDQDGKRVREAAVWLPESQRILIYSVAIGPNGQIVAGGSANKADGTQVPFISLSDVNGKLVSALQTIGFGPRNICLAPDGTVWSFGGTGYDGSQPKPGDTCVISISKRGKSALISHALLFHEAGPTCTHKSSAPQRGFRFIACQLKRALR